MATSRRQKGSALRQPQRRPQSSSSTWPPATSDRPWYVEDWSFGDAPPPEPEPPKRPILGSLLVLGALILLLVCVLAPVGDRSNLLFQTFTAGAAGFYAIFGNGGQFGLLGASMLPLFLLSISVMMTTMRFRTSRGLLIGGLLAVLAGAFFVPAGAAAILGGVIHILDAKKELPGPSPQFFAGKGPPPR